MPVTMHEASVPAFRQILVALNGVLTKASAHCEARKIDPLVLASARLFPDMLPLTRQVLIACDFARNTTARLAGRELEKWADDEKTFEELRDRIGRTLAALDAVEPSELDGSETRDIAFTIAGRPVTMKGSPYLFRFALPNFYFHAATAYDILRENGVEIGKRDFLGPMPL